jgi:hypothetical protein
MAKSSNTKKKSKELEIDTTNPLMQIVKKSMTGALGGRPRKYKNANDLRKEIIKYFQYCADSYAAPTISGLSLFCGFESRQSFYDYAKSDKFSYTIEKARLVIEAVYESKLHGTNPAGAIFALKNMGWNDKQQIEDTTPEKQVMIIGGKEIIF